MLRLCLLLIVLAGALAQERALVQEEDLIQPRGLVALAVGNAAYRQSPLVNPVNDATAIAGALREMGFAVELATDADYRSLGVCIDRFVHRLRRGDVAVFYFAGHGMQIEGENYLIPTDFDTSEETSAKYAAYPADRLLEGMERSGAKLNIVILDACRNNPYRTSRAFGGGLAPMGSGTGTFVALATSPGKTAADNSRSSHGLFTGCLLESLKQPGLSLDELFNRTRKLVDHESQGAQTPWTQTNVIGTFYFRPMKTGGEAMLPQVGQSSGTPAPMSGAAVRTQAGVAQQNGGSLYLLGVSQARLDNSQTAVRTLSEAIQQNPKNQQAYYERAMS